MISTAVLERLRQLFGNHTGPVLSLYCDINPARPENQGRAWVTRIRTTLRDIPELHLPRKHGRTLFRELIAYLEQLSPDGRTLACFAAENNHDLKVDHLTLQAELPVVDLAHGRVEARYGPPYLAPLAYAFDKYPRTGVLHLARGRWRFYEIFLNELREDTGAFASISPPEWNQLLEAGRLFVSRRLREKAGENRDKFYARSAAWTHKFYERLAALLAKAAERLQISRLVLMGDDWQTAHFESYLPKSLRPRLAGRVSHPENAAAPTPPQILQRVTPVLEEAERKEEMDLLHKARTGGLWGIGPVLEALQAGRVAVWILPWRVSATVWRCPQGLIAASRADAAAACPDPQPVPLQDLVFDLACNYGARLEFVRGEVEQRLQDEFQGTAAILRWPSTGNRS